MVALLARLVAVMPVLLHGVFGCCWHHAHFHAHASAFCTPSEHDSAGESSVHEHRHATDAGRLHNDAQAMCVHHSHSELPNRTSLADGASESTEEDGCENECEDGCDEDRCALSLLAVPSGVRSETSSEVDFSKMLLSHDSLRLVFRASSFGSAVSSDPPFGGACLHRARLQVWRI